MWSLLVLGQIQPWHQVSASPIQFYESLSSSTPPYTQILTIMQTAKTCIEPTNGDSSGNIASNFDVCGPGQYYSRNECGAHYTVGDGTLVPPPAISPPTQCNHPSHLLEVSRPHVRTPWGPIGRSLRRVVLIYGRSLAGKGRRWWRLHLHCIVDLPLKDCFQCLMMSQ